MKSQIAQKLFDWVKEAGPTANGDAYNQERIDEVDDFLGGHVGSPVPLTDAEAAFCEEHGDLVSDEMERFLFW